jgi:hypothetical protein
VDWVDVFDRQRARSEGAQGEVLRGNAAYGAGLALLMAGRDAEAHAWFEQAASSWRASWADATPTSWGRPIGVIKARMLADDEHGAAEAAMWALSLGTEDAESPIGRYAATLALLVGDRYPDARHVASTIRERDDFPHDVADALALIAAHDVVGYAESVEAVLESFEARDAYLEDVPVADTVIVLQKLAARRGIEVELPQSPVLPAAASSR